MTAPIDHRFRIQTILGFLGLAAFATFALFAAARCGGEPQGDDNIVKTEGALTCNTSNTVPFPALLTDHVYVVDDASTWIVKATGAVDHSRFSGTTGGQVWISAPNAVFRNETHVTDGSFVQQMSASYQMLVWPSPQPPAPGTNGGCQWYLHVQTAFWNWSGSIWQGPGYFDLYIGTGSRQLREVYAVRPPNGPDYQSTAGTLFY